MNRRSPPQRGNALITALVLISVSSLLGVATLRSSRFEVQISAAENAREAIFRSAEAAATAAINSVDAGNLPADDTPVEVPSLEIEPGISVVSHVRYDGMVPIINSSVGLFAARLYSVESSATVTTIGAESAVRQGGAHRSASLQR